MSPRDFHWKKRVDDVDSTPSRPREHEGLEIHCYREWVDLQRYWPMVAIRDVYTANQTTRKTYQTFVDPEQPWISLHIPIYENLPSKRHPIAISTTTYKPFPSAARFVDFSGHKSVILKEYTQNQRWQYQQGSTAPIH
jgi:hypothetical protein